MNLPISKTAFGFSDVATRLRTHLSLDVPHDPLGDSFASAGDHVLNPDIEDTYLARTRKAAAVLVPMIARDDEVTVLLTQRTAHLRSHAGQISFPGGKIDATDASPIHAALREAHEEIGLAAKHIEPVGFLNPYLTGTGFRILPVVGLVTPPFDLEVNPGEVDDAFEVPLSFLMNPDNHKRDSREWNGKMRHFYAMPYEGRYIWGATAGILRNLYERLYS